MQTREYKVKVTTDPGFTETQISQWLNDVSSKGWELATCTYFGQGMLWIFERARIAGQPQDPENIDENAPT